MMNVWVAEVWLAAWPSESVTSIVASPAVPLRLKERSPVALSIVGAAANTVAPVRTVMLNVRGWPVSFGPWLIDVAHGQCFDAVLTISSEVPGTTGPVVDQRKLRDVVLQHYSWNHLLALAQRERAGGQAEQGDPDRSWVLSELIRYLEHPRSGAIGDREASAVVRGVTITDEDALVATAVPESRPPVVDLREPQITVLHTVLIAESAVRKPPTLPSRREVRLVRQLGAHTGEQAAARNDAGWYQDPEDAGQLRWWDGVEWSERTYPGQPALA